MEEPRRGVEHALLHLGEREVGADGLRVEAVDGALILLHPISRAVRGDHGEPRLALLRKRENLRVLLGCDRLRGLVQLGQQSAHVGGSLDQLVHRCEFRPVVEAKLVRQLRGLQHLRQQLFVGRIRATIVGEIHAVAEIFALGVAHHRAVVGLVGGQCGLPVGCGRMACKVICGQAVELSFVLHDDLALALGDVALEVQRLDRQLVAQLAHPLARSSVLVDAAQSVLQQRLAEVVACRRVGGCCVDRKQGMVDIGVQPESRGLRGDFLRNLIAHIAQRLVGGCVGQQGRAASRKVQLALRLIEGTQRVLNRPRAFDRKQCIDLRLRRCHVGVCPCTRLGRVGIAHPDMQRIAVSLCRRTCLCRRHHCSQYPDPHCCSERPLHVKISKTPRHAKRAATRRSPPQRAAD